MGQLRLPIGSNGRTSAARLFNCFAEAAPQGKQPVALIGCPGIPTLGTLPKTPYRGSATYNDVLYAVSNDTLYSIAQNGDTTALGTIAGSGRVSMAANRDALVIGTNSTDYVYDGTLAAITDPDFVDSSIVDVLDSFAVWIRPGTDQVASSGLADSGSYDALDFATAEAKPDKLVSQIVDHNQLILLGSETTEIWYNDGSTGFPFSRIPNGVIEVGCGAAYSVAKADSGVFWLDDEYLVRRLVNIQAAKISTHAIDELIRGAANKDEARGFTYTSDGHIFYCLNVGDVSVHYDASTGEWHERSSVAKDRWRVDDMVKAYNGFMAFDRESGAFGFIDEGVNTEFDEEIRAAWRYPSVYAEGRVATHKRLETMVRSGEAPIGLDAQIGLRVSDDGGKTFEELPTRSIGKQGEYQAAPIWTKLGSSRDRVYEHWIADNSRRLVVDTQLEVIGGRL